MPARELPCTFSAGAIALFYILLPPVLLHLLVFHLVLFEYLAVLTFLKNFLPVIMQK